MDLARQTAAACWCGTTVRLLSTSTTTTWPALAVEGPLSYRAGRYALYAAMYLQGRGSATHAFRAPMLGKLTVTFFPRP